MEDIPLLTQCFACEYKITLNDSLIHMQGVRGRECGGGSAGKGVRGRECGARSAGEGVREKECGGGSAREGVRESAN